MNKEEEKATVLNTSGKVKGEPKTAVAICAAMSLERVISL